jgi:hypothetical protein
MCKVWAETHSAVVALALFFSDSLCGPLCYQFIHGKNGDDLYPTGGRLPCIRGGAAVGWWGKLILTLAMTITMGNIGYSSCLPAIADELFGSFSKRDFGGCDDLSGPQGGRGRDYRVREKERERARERETSGDEILRCVCGCMRGGGRRWVKTGAEHPHPPPTHTHVPAGLEGYLFLLDRVASEITFFECFVLGKAHLVRDKQFSRNQSGGWYVEGAVKHVVKPGQAPFILLM